MEPLRFAFDLSELARRSRGNKRLESAVGRIVAVAIAHEHLSEVQQLCEQLIKHDCTVPIGVQDKNHALLGQALQTSAVITYVRGTVGDSDHKHRVDVLPALSDGQKEKHRAIVSLRNTALAHYGPGVGRREAWRSHRLVLMEHLTYSRFMVAAQYTNYRAQVTLDLLNLAETLIPRLIQMSEQRTAVLADMIAMDSGLKRAVAALPFDAYAFFVDRNDAEAFMRGEGELTMRKSHPQP